MKCKVCGKEFELKVDNHYIARDEEIDRCGIAGIVGSNNEIEGKLYDTFDCPACGCQNIMQERKRRFLSVTSTGYPDEVCFIEKEGSRVDKIPECFGEYDEMCQICDVMEACKKEKETMEEV